MWEIDMWGLGGYRSIGNRHRAQDDWRVVLERCSRPFTDDQCIRKPAD